MGVGVMGLALEELVEGAESEEAEEPVFQVPDVGGEQRVPVDEVEEAAEELIDFRLGGVGFDEVPGEVVGIGGGQEPGVVGLNGGMEGGGLEFAQGVESAAAGGLVGEVAFLKEVEAGEGPGLGAEGAFGDGMDQALVLCPPFDDEAGLGMAAQVKNDTFGMDGGGH